MRRTLSGISIILSLVLALAAFGAIQGTSFTYQGQLRRSGAAFNGLCNFHFSLWDAASAGTQQGSTLPINGVNVTNGLFTVVLDFGDQFRGGSRWLATSVQCSGDGGFTPLDPRQPITAAPYALSLRPGATIEGGTSGGTVLRLSNPQGVGLSGSGHELGVEGIGTWGVYGLTREPGGIGVYGLATTSNGAGIYGSNSAGGTAIWGVSFGGGPGIYGQNATGGLAGRFDGPVDIAGPLTVNASGVAGVFGNTINASGSGVHGAANGANAAGVFGVNSAGPGIWGRSTGNGSAVYGENTGAGFAGRFIGPVHVQGNLSKSTGTFRIDHPLDPANKFLSHSFVESPDMMNIYNGNVVTDARGSATIIMPAYFEALNREFRYQLTVLGQFAQAIVSRKISGNSFEIRTDQPGVEVSWQVTGIRQDAYAKEHPIVVEELKPAEQKGRYLYPAGFGAGEEQRIGHVSRPSIAPGSQEARAAGSGVQPPSK